MLNPNVFDAADEVYDPYTLAAAAILGLEIKGEWRHEVAANFKLLAAAAAAIGAVMPADDGESALVFQA